jgi:hypothetical protein
MQRNCNNLASFFIGEKWFVQPTTAHNCDMCIGSAAPIGLIELLTYRLHQMPIGAGKL